MNVIIRVLIICLEFSLAREALTYAVKCQYIVLVTGYLYSQIEEREVLSDDEFMAIMMGVQSACDAAKAKADAI